MSKQNWRWINDTHEVPQSEKRDYEQAKNELVFRAWKKEGLAADEVLDKEQAKAYSAWLAKQK